MALGDGNVFTSLYTQIDISLPEKKKKERINYNKDPMCGPSE